MNLYKFSWNDPDKLIEGLFIAEESEIDSLIGQQAGFGALYDFDGRGAGIFEEDQFESMGVSSETIAELLRVFESTTLFGVDPRNHLD